MHRIGVLLAGCGRYDGSDVHETVLLASALERRGARMSYLAPDVDQTDVFDHTTGERADDAPRRRILDEAARLAPGAVGAVEGFPVRTLHALVIPGGAGVVRALCESGSGILGGGNLLPAVRALLDGLAGQGAPVAAVGVAELVLARWLGEPMSGDGVAMTADEVRVRDDRNVLYTPGRLRARTLAETAASMDRLAETLMMRLSVRPCGATPGRSL